MLIYFTLYISEFSVQRTLFNQPTEAYLKAKNVLHCQHGKDRKASAKMKAKETKAEYYVDVL